MLVLFLHHHNNVCPGSILQQTNHVVMSNLWNVEEKGKEMPLFTFNTLLKQMVIIPSVFFIPLCFRINNSAFSVSTVSSLTL